MLASYKSSLRVYEPLWAFEPEARVRWSRYVMQAGAEGSLERERAAMLQAVAGERLDLRRLGVGEDALVVSWDGGSRVCPLDTESRVLQAVVDSEWKLPYPLSDLTLGRATRRQAAGLQLRPRRGSRPDAKDHVLTASWDVPFWWSLLFTRAEAVPTEDLESLVYRVSITKAITRGENALEIISSTFGIAPFLADLDAVIRWLRTFDGDSMVELDYGSLGDLVVNLSDDGDDSMSLASEAIDYLTGGDLESALTAYQEYISTWEDVSRLESWN